MKAISAHVTGFYRSSFHAYTTEVNVDGHRWRLGLRYSKFHDFYDQLAATEKEFHAEFPPKGSLFFTPKPEERQEQLETFLQQVLIFYAAKGFPREIEDLLCDLLKVPRHLRSPEHEDDDVSTSTESVLDEPMHEPMSSSDSIASVENVMPKEEEEDKEVPVAETETQQSLEKEEESSVKEEEKIDSASEPEQPETPVPTEPVAREPHPVEEEASSTHDDDVKVETPASAGETTKESAEDVAKETVQDKPEELAAAQIPGEDQPHTDEVAEDEVGAEVVGQTAIAAEPQPEEPKVEELPVVEAVAQKVVSAPTEPQTAEKPIASEITSPKQDAAPKELASSGRVSSWIAAFLPKSLLGFIRRRCLKKTNLVVLCVALLLPMTKYNSPMREIDARVVGFDYSTYHAYTTEVEVDGCSWSLAIRYNTFYQFYTRLVALEKHFTVEFPPKGGLFFSPPPEERQEQLDDFLLSTLAYFDMRGHPKRMGALLGELLQIPEHLETKEEDDERTASEGSSVAEELLDGDHDVHMDNLTAQILEKDTQVEVEVGGDELEAEEDNQEAFEELQEIAVADAVADHDQEVIAPVELEVNADVEAELEEKPEVAEEELEEEQVSTEAMTSPKSDTNAFPVERQQSQELTGGSVAKNYIAMLRRKSLVDGAIQAAVVSTMKANVEKSKADKVGEAAEEKEPIQVEEVNSTDVVAEVQAVQPETSKTVEMDDQVVNTKELVEVEEKELEPVALEMPVETNVTSAAKATESTSVEPTSVSDSISPLDTLESEVVVTDAESFDEQESPVEKPNQDTEQASAPTSGTQPADPVQEDQEDESSSEEENEEEATPEPVKEETESENPVVSWFRRMGTFGPTAAEKEEQEAVAVKKLQEEKEAAARVEAEAKAKAEAIAKAQEELKAAEAEAKAKEAVDAEHLRVEQELNLRLGPYRHPVFFQGFNCDVGTSRYSLPQRLSDGIVV
ncbi:hypothetical protein P3T76_012932 [Phytophthora citrophthora]|uniref:PX domain-containing protein n=1 Tax=Phytophthora citrophthora TaxID=4793 RepID=A0AAD9G4Y4_9STRA|nr:hypothetical protein P3T76_012932 [Phytophthora citrophthora]